MTAEPFLQHSKAKKPPLEPRGGIGRHIRQRWRCIGDVPKISVLAG
jgi:hypothetical protein